MSEKQFNNSLTLDETVEFFGKKGSEFGKFAVGFLGSHNLLHLQDRKAAGVGGGSFTLGAWRTRTLNTVVTNSIPESSLVSNQILLPSGRYFFEGTGVSFAVNATTSRLYNITASALLLLGLTITSGPSDATAVCSSVSGDFTLSAPSTIEFQSVCIATHANGYGPAMADVGQTSNVFADVKIWKLS